jgi:hypothetical protein
MLTKCIQKLTCYLEGHGMHKVTTGKHLRKHLSINIRTSFWQSRQIQVFIIILFIISVCVEGLPVVHVSYMYYLNQKFTETYRFQHTLIMKRMIIKTNRFDHRYFFFRLYHKYQHNSGKLNM